MEYFANEKSIKERLQLYFFKNQKSSNLNFVLNEVGKFKFKKNESLRRTKLSVFGFNAALKPMNLSNFLIFSTIFGFNTAVKPEFRKKFKTFFEICNIF